MPLHTFTLYSLVMTDAATIQHQECHLCTKSERVGFMVRHFANPSIHPQLQLGVVMASPYLCTETSLEKGWPLRT